MSKKQTIIRGTLILTMTGFLSRFMGFFYRIFLSRTFGEEGIGLYQLIFPVYTLCFALTISGVETAISRTVARKTSQDRPDEALEILFAGFVFSFFLSCLCLLGVQRYAGPIAAHFLGDVRCEPLLTAVSYTIPFSAIHSCICGYCYGLKRTKIPALAQLCEQTARILFVFLLYRLLLGQQRPVTILLAVLGLIAGEMASAVYTLFALRKFCRQTPYIQKDPPRLTFPVLLSRQKELLSLSLPLSANRILITLLQSIEAVSIPGQLAAGSMNTAEALSTYGVLTGMALPCILFPSAITNSVATMLMPTVAEIQVSQNRREMTDIIRKAIGACFTIGFGCCLFFLLFGHWIGLTLFGSASAGKFILTLSWMCPFLYTNSAVLSIINGLGKTTLTFFINTLGLLLRIGSIFLGIPSLGIQGYLYGLLVSQLLVSLLGGASILHILYGKRSNGTHSP